MNILAVSDLESPYLWDYYEPGRFDGIDLILAAGDLAPEYLSFLVTLSSAPVLYVRGNHDSRCLRTPPEGCVCIEDTLYIHEGLRILGLGGSMYYDGGEHQYTEGQMRTRALRQFFPLLRHGGFDILLSHAPALGVGDDAYLPYRGYRTFCRLMDRCRPRYFIHGHVHKNYCADFQRCRKYGQTTVINAYEYYQFTF